MSERGRVLIVDGDYEILGSLARALRDRGHHVVLAADGRAGLQRAVETAPEIVIVDRDVPVVDVRTFLEVLRDNPRTSRAHPFIMGYGDPGQLASLDAHGEPIIKPFNADEVASRVDEELQRRLGGRRDPELRGDLEQVALFDLLQVFSANRRTGRLSVDGPTARGEVWVDEGRIVDAEYRGAVGQKALYRILAVRSGSFVFAPGLHAERQRIDLKTDHLLMEGARQADETARVSKSLPPLSAVVSVAKKPDELTPLAAELLRNLDEPRSLEELLDTVTASDLPALEALQELIGKDAFLIFDPASQQTSLCDEDEAIALRAAAIRLRRPGIEGPIRLGVLCESAPAVARFARALSGIDQFVASQRPPTPAGGSAVGALGVIRLDGADMEIFAVPMDRTLRPLWGPLLAAARVALFLSDQPISDEIADVLATLGVRPVQISAGWERPVGAADAIRTALAPTPRRTPTIPEPR
ncbi:MAG: DUF4388 domain-containing protein [Myxococcota bacterium]